MAFFDTEDDDTADSKRLAHKERRAALRDFVDEIATIVQKIDLPETYLEAERGARCLWVNDRALQQLPDAAGPDLNDGAIRIAKPTRRLIRRRADQLMEAATLITKPDSYLEGERAGRYALACDRLLSQLYEEPRATAKAPKLPAFADDFVDEEDDVPEADEDIVTRLEAKLDHLRAARAQAFGFWECDGSPFDPKYPRAGCPDGERPPAQPKRLRIDDDTLSAMTADAAPAVATALARLTETPEHPLDHPLAHPLDRPVWSALTSGLSPLVTGAGPALRLKPPYSAFGGAFGAAARYDAAALKALNNGEAVWLVEPPDVAAQIPDALITDRRQWRQMIFDRFPDYDFSRGPRFQHNIRHQLGAADRNEMQGLAEICGLPPFPPDVHVFGDWIGTRVHGKLVSMAGTRLFLPGYTEITGICTHPDYRCDGLAERTLHVVVTTIVARGDTPFLHVDVDDAEARAYAHKAGFVDRKTLEVVVLSPPHRDGEVARSAGGAPLHRRMDGPVRGPPASQGEINITRL